MTILINSSELRETIDAFVNKMQSLWFRHLPGLVPWANWLSLDGEIGSMLELLEVAKKWEDVKRFKGHWKTITFFDEKKKIKFNMSFFPYPEDKNIGLNKGISYSYAVGWKYYPNLSDLSF